MPIKCTKTNVNKFLSKLENWGKVGYKCYINIIHKNSVRSLHHAMS